MSGDPMRAPVCFASSTHLVFLEGKGQHLRPAAVGPAHTSPARAPLLAKGSLLKRLFPCSVCQICPVWVQLRMLFFSRPCTLCSPPAWPLFGPRAIAASSTYSALESPAPLLPLQKGQLRRLTQRSPAIRGRAKTEKGL